MNRYDDFVTIGRPICWCFGSFFVLFLSRRVAVISCLATSVLGVAIRIFIIHVLQEAAVHSTVEFQLWFKSGDNLILPICWVCILSEKIFVILLRITSASPHQSVVGPSFCTSVGDIIAKKFKNLQNRFVNDLIMILCEHYKHTYIDG